MPKSSKPESPRRAQKAAPIPDLVPHPRYGEAVTPSGCTATEEEIRASYYGYARATLYAESAIPADITRQNFSTFPRGYYVDLLKQCRDCQRPFIFFAREQQHWYEVLGFYIDADCERCVGCRRSERELRSRFRRYSQTVGNAGIRAEALATLARDAVYLWKAGILRDEQQLRRIRNLARRHLPSHAATRSIERAIAEAEE